MNRREIATSAAKLLRRIRLAIGRAVLEAVDDSAGIQLVRLHGHAGEDVLDRVERFQSYGLTSRPKPGAEAIAVQVGGSRSHLVVLAIDDRRVRLRNLGAGEVALYDDAGNEVRLKQDGTISVIGDSEVTVDAPSVTITGSGSVSIDGAAVTIRSREFLAHTHSGVQTGGGTTGGVV